MPAYAALWHYSRLPCPALPCPAPLRLMAGRQAAIGQGGRQAWS